MKLKLLLADDDIEMLGAMNGMLEESAEDYEVLALAEDGLQALELVRQTKPDILITDITMPQMDGIELIAESKKLLPELKTVLITCHEDFHYAKEAIKLMVDEYLVKYTLTKKGLWDCLEKVRQKLELQHIRQDSFNQISSEIYRNREHFKELYLNALAQGQVSAGLSQKALMYDIALPQGEQRLIAFFVDDFAYALKNSILNDDDKLLRFSLTNIIMDVFCNLSAFAFLHEGHIFLLLPTEKQGYDEEDLMERLRQILGHAKEILNIYPNAVVLSEPFLLQHVGQALRKVQDARAAYFYQSGGCVIKAGSEPISFAASADSDDWAEAFRQKIFQPKQLAETFLSVQRKLLEQQRAPQDAKDVLEELNIVLDMAMRLHGHKLPQTKVTGETFVGCVRQVQINLELWYTYMSQNKQVTFSQDIQETVQYMTDHLDSDISLERVAAVIYKNSSYLSRLFKRETGLTFTEYLTQKRIEKAIWLLSETTMSVEAIGESIGIYNTQYFYKFFKRETGKRPGDLRKRLDE